MVGPHILVGNLGGARLIPALLLPSLTHNAPQTESSALCSVQPHTPTHPQGTSQPAPGLPTDCVPSCPQGPPRALLPSLLVHSENQGKGVPTWTLVLHVQPKCHRHCPLRAWNSPPFQSSSQPLCPLLPSQPPTPQSSAPLARPDRGNSVLQRAAPSPSVAIGDTSSATKSPHEPERLSLGSAPLSPGIVLSYQVDVVWGTRNPRNRRRGHKQDPPFNL